MGSQAVAAPQQWNRYCNSLNNPLRYVDRNGRWPTEIHDDIIGAAFGGLSDVEVKQIQTGSWAVDWGSPMGMTSAYAYRHGMTGPGQDPGEAARLGDAYIAGHSSRAVNFAKASLWNNALFEFGMGLHTVVDRLSPRHAGNQVWWGPDMIPLGLLPGLGRMVAGNIVDGWSDHPGEEGRGVISRAEFTNLVKEARRHYLNVFGLEKFSKATGGCKTVEGCKVDEADMPVYLRKGGLE